MSPVVLCCNIFFGWLEITKRQTGKVVNESKISSELHVVDNVTPKFKVKDEFFLIFRTSFVLFMTEESPNP